MCSQVEKKLYDRIQFLEDKLDKLSNLQQDKFEGENNIITRLENLEKTMVASPTKLAPKTETQLQADFQKKLTL